MSKKFVTHKCDRCGVDSWGQFCRDCRAVDPWMTAGGLTARQMYDKERLPFDREELVEAELTVALGAREEHRKAAAKRAAKLRRTIQEREKRIGLVA